MLFLFAILFPLHASAFELKYLDSVHWAPVVDFQGSKVGGISGLSPLPGGGYLAISDDRSVLGPSRAYLMDFSFDAETQKLRVNVRKEIPLRLPNGETYPQMALDPEGIVALSDGRFLVSTEGDNRPSPRMAPAVMLMDESGRWLQDLPLPAKLIPEGTGEQTRGILNNAGFETLTLAPGGTDLFSLTEASIQQDGAPSDFEHGSLLRLVHWQDADAGFALAGEYAYPLSPVPLLVQGTNPAGGVGASESLALDASTLLVMERAYEWTDTDERTNIRLFHAELSGAEEISGADSILDRGVRTMSKKLVFDFDATLPLLPAGHQRIDNLEAMAWGPLTKEGHRTLIVASDSNFSSTQETQFFLLEVLE